MSLKTVKYKHPLHLPQIAIDSSCPICGHLPLLYDDLLYDDQQCIAGKKHQYGSNIQRGLHNRLVDIYVDHNMALVVDAF